MLRLTPGAYEAHPRLCVLAVHFNALGYRTPRVNFLRFLEPLVRGRAHVVVAEGLYADVPPLPAAVREAETWVGVPCEGGLWQKERLLNVALERVPDSCSAVAWLDGDVLFGDPRWMPKAVEALDGGQRFVQPFHNFVRLPRQPDAAGGLVWAGYGYQVARDSRAAGQDWVTHGHTGLAWAGPADLLRSTGLYDRWISGTGDHLMAHAMTSTVDSPCVAEALGADTPGHRDFSRWAAGWASAGPAGVGCLEGAIFQLWHGEYGNRRYLEREADLRALGYDPRADLELTHEGAWRLRPGRRDINDWADALLGDRREDG